MLPATRIQYALDAHMQRSMDLHRYVSIRDKKRCGAALRVSPIFWTKIRITKVHYNENVIKTFNMSENRFILTRVRRTLVYYVRRGRGQKHRAHALYLCSMSPYAVGVGDRRLSMNPAVPMSRPTLSRIQ